MRGEKVVDETNCVLPCKCTRRDNRLRECRCQEYWDMLYDLLRDEEAIKCMDQELLAEAMALLEANKAGIFAPI